MIRFVSLTRFSATIFRSAAIALIFMAAVLLPAVTATTSPGTGLALNINAHANGTNSGSNNALSATPKVYINEILATNHNDIEDEDGDNVPWIELYNAESEPVNLHQVGLSDDPDRPWRWQFPDVTIEPGEFMLIFASGKDRRDPDRQLHANFRVSRDGEQISLTDINGNTIDLVPPIPMEPDISYGRLPDGSDHFQFFRFPTPGQSNESDGFLEDIDPPGFSRSGGFYHSGFDLELTAGPGDAEIRYTLDGSLPDTTSPRYTGPIRITDRSSEPNNLSMIKTSPPGIVPTTGFRWIEPLENIFKGTVVRARVFREGARPSPVVTHSYFIDDQGPDRYHLPVVSVVTDSLHLFDYERGIYVPGKVYDDRAEGADDSHLIGNFSERGREWERPATFELFDEHGNLEHVQDIGIRIHGGASRSLSMKSLRFYARSDYGENRINHRIFPDLPYDSYNRLILRNSGQDFFVRSTMFRDAFLQELVRDFNFDTQAYRPVIVFINGEYWGIQNFRERYDTDYLARNYNVDAGRIDMLEDNAEIQEGSNEHYNEMLDYIRENDITRDHHYEHITTMIDVDNFLDYISTQAFIRNIDWPGNNNDYWRLQTEYDPDAPPGHDGRWRWMLVDTDAAFGGLNPFRVTSYDMMNHMTNPNYGNWPNPAWSTFLIRELLENETFRNDFINRSVDYMNSVFHPEHVISLIDKFEANLEPVIEEHIMRWGQIESKERWRFYIDRMRKFAEERPQYHFEHIAKYFDLKGTAELTIDVSSLKKGRVQINSLKIDEHLEGPASSENTYPWKGTYFREFPVTLVAHPYDGYRFSHWEGKGVSDGYPEDTLQVRPRGNMEIKAVFAPGERSKDRYPEPHQLSNDAYFLETWDADEEPGSYPENMVFMYMENHDPRDDDEVAGFTSGPYNSSIGSRINGLGSNGFSFLNTSEPDIDGYPGRRLGAASLALDTREMKNIRVSWTGGTVEPGTKRYGLRLQYRINGEGSFQDVTDEHGGPVTYEGNDESGHSLDFELVELPGILENKPYAEIAWRYYYTGDDRDEDGHDRDELRVGGIHVKGDPLLMHDGEPVRDHGILPNYPNPFNNSTTIQFTLPEESRVSITIYDVNGRRVKTLRDNVRLSAGYHSFQVDASRLASGMYIYRVETPDWTGHEKMTIIR